jgi:hypothetical protein
MNDWKLRLGLVLAICIGGCVPSLNPLYTDKDLVFDSVLVGTWRDPDNGTWTFRKAGAKSYKLRYAEKGVSAAFDVHLVRLGKSLFLDSYPDASGMVRNDFYRLHFVAGHVILKLVLKKDSLNLTALNSDWLQKGIAAHRLKIRHEPFGRDRVLLTASTAELQEFIRKHAEDPDAFHIESKDKLVRIKTAPTTQP